MTNKQKAASRANGAKSRGPKTEEGRQLSSQNSIKHGLYSSAVVLSNENKERFLNVRQSYIHRFQPADSVELELIEQMVAATWRLHRVWSMETDALEDGMVRVQPELDRKYDKYPEETRICAAMESIWKANPNSLEFLSRNETRLARLHHRALHDLLKLRQFVPPPADAPEEIVLPPVPSEPVSPQLEIVEKQPEPVAEVAPLSAPVAASPVAETKTVRNEPETTLTSSISVASNRIFPRLSAIAPRILVTRS